MATLETPLIRNNLLIRFTFQNAISAGAEHRDSFTQLVYTHLNISGVTNQQIRKTPNGQTVHVSAHVPQIHKLITQRYEPAWMGHLLSSVLLEGCRIMIEDALCSQYVYIGDHFTMVSGYCEVIDFHFIPRDAYECLTRTHELDNVDETSREMKMLDTFLTLIWHLQLPLSGNRSLLLVLDLKKRDNSTFEFKRQSVDPNYYNQSYVYVTIYYKNIKYHDTLLTHYGRFDRSSVPLLLHRYRPYMAISLANINLKKVCIVSAHFPLDIVKMIQAFII